MITIPDISAFVNNSTEYAHYLFLNHIPDNIAVGIAIGFLIDLILALVVGGIYFIFSLDIGFPEEKEKFLAKVAITTAIIIIGVCIFISLYIDYSKCSTSPILYILESNLQEIPKTYLLN